MNTQETRPKTIDSLKYKSENMDQFYSTYSGKLEEVLLTQRKLSNEKKNVKSQRLSNQAKFIIPDSPSMFKENSQTFSDREINQELMDIDDSLSDVPVRDCPNMDDELDMSNNFFMEDSENLLDNLDFISPISNKFQKESDEMSGSNSKTNTPSFKIKKVRHKVRSSLNFNDSKNLAAIELGNIPEVLDESNY